MSGSGAPVESKSALFNQDSLLLYGIMAGSTAVAAKFIQGRPFFDALTSMDAGLGAGIGAVGSVYLSSTGGMRPLLFVLPVAIPVAFGGISAALPPIAGMAMMYVGFMYTLRPGFLGPK